MVEYTMGRSKDWSLYMYFTCGGTFGTPDMQVDAKIQPYIHKMC